MKKKKITIFLDNQNNLKLILFALKNSKTVSEVVQKLIDEHIEV